MSTFSSLGLRPQIIQALDELGFEKPTPIQEQAIPQVLGSQRDLIALAQTGTGKTAAFSLPVLQQLETESLQIQSIILCPTRELCLQITKDLERFAKFMDLKTVAVYGGASIETQIRAIKRGCQIIVGTPGRTVDLINRRVLQLQHVRFVVLDEADEMLTMGFKDDLDTILAETPKEKQTLLFSATLPKGIREISSKYMHDPAEVAVKGGNEGAKNIEHHYYLVSARDKYECVKRLADVNPKIYGIIFCRTRRETKEIADRLIRDGYNADALHGDLSQQQRDTIMGRFRKRDLQLLVATDVAARGLDVDELTHVINYNLPDEEEVYIHRSGRTGRAGNKGISIAIIHGREKGKLKAVERKLKAQFVQQKVPTGHEICEKQLFAIVGRLSDMQINEKQIEPFLPTIMQQLGHLSKEELIKHLVSFEFDRFLEYYRNARDLNVPDKGGKNREDRRSDDRGGDKKSWSQVDFTRFHINLGKKNGMNAATLMGVINEALRKRDVEIGKIELMDTFSFFEIDSSYADKLQKEMRTASHNGKSIDLSLAVSTGANSSRGGGKKERFKKKFSKNNKRPSGSKWKKGGRRSR